MISISIPLGVNSNAMDLTPSLGDRNHSFKGLVKEGCERA